MTINGDAKMGSFRLNSVSELDFPRPIFNTLKLDYFDYAPVELCFMGSLYWDKNELHR